VQPGLRVRTTAQINEARGRPLGVASTKSGALPVGDDTGNTVWRVSAAHPQLTQR